MKLKPPFIHPSAIVDTPTIGQGSRIWAFVHILENAQIGKNANICDHCFIENKVVVGDNVTIKCGVWLWDGVTIEDDVFIGPSVAFTNDFHPRSRNKNFQLQPTLLKKGCSIGANAVILPGVTVGCHAMVGAGSVVTKDVGDYQLIYGNPAKLHGHVCVCGNKLSPSSNNLKMTCDCGRSFVKTDLGLVEEE